jgi:PKD repeat protein
MQHTSKKDTVSILNTGCDTLFISNIQSNNASFTILNGNLSYLLPGAYVDIVINFSSSTVGNQTGTITIFNNDVDTFLHVYGSTFAAPIVSPSVATIARPIRACSETDSTTFIISNPGGSDLTYNIGSLPSWVSVTPTNGIISPGISDTIHITYGSYTFSGGPQSANISISSNDPLTPTKTVAFTMNVDSNPCVTVSVVSNTCTGFSTFTTSTINSPNSYDWSFGDSNSSNLPNPVHGFPSNGNYTTTLIACNAHGCDTVVVPINAIITGPRATNCYPTTVAYCCGIGITLFQISGPVNFLINNSTSDAIDGYSDYTCTDTASLVTNYPYGINVTTGFGYVETVKMWLDLNNDGQFDTLTEQMFADSAVLTNHTGNFTIPDRPTNDYSSPLRLRIGSDFSGNTPPSPCQNLQFGQYEDYSIFLSYYDAVNEVNRETGFQVYPNPFGSTASIEYNLKKSSKVSVEIFNILGEKVGTPAADQMQLPGKHSYNFSGQPTGVYFVKLTVDDKSAVKKVIKM